MSLKGEEGDFQRLLQAHRPDKDSRLEVQSGYWKRFSEDPSLALAQEGLIRVWISNLTRVKARI